MIRSFNNSKMMRDSKILLFKFINLTYNLIFIFSMNLKRLIFPSIFINICKSKFCYYSFTSPELIFPLKDDFRRTYFKIFYSQSLFGIRSLFSYFLIHY